MSPGPLYRRFLESGDDSAWNALVIALLPVVAKIAYRVSYQRGIRQSHLLDDAIQEALLKLQAQRETLRVRLSKIPGTAIEAYIKQLAANAVRDYWNSEIRKFDVEEAPEEVPFEVFVESAGLSVHPTVDRDLLYRQIHDLLRDRPRDLLIFRLYYQYGLGAREVSSIESLALSEKGVESRLNQIKKRIRRALGTDQEAGSG